MRFTPGCCGCEGCNCRRLVSGSPVFCDVPTGPLHLSIPAGGGGGAIGWAAASCVLTWQSSARYWYGFLPLVLSDGVAHETTRPVTAVCRCDKSQSFPWCDGTHKVLPEKLRPA